MSSRFHNKWHRHNHHSDGRTHEPNEPDATHDPIASQNDPFYGDFALMGGLSAHAPNASAYSGLFISNQYAICAVGTPSNFSKTSYDAAGNPGIGIFSNSIYTHALTSDNALFTNLSATVATIQFIDVIYTETSGYTFRDGYDNVAIPVAHPAHGSIWPYQGSIVLLSSIPISGNSWASFAGNIQTHNNLHVSGDAAIGGALVAGAIQASGSNLQVQFNDTGYINGDAGLVFDPGADTLYVVQLSANATASREISARSTINMAGNSLINIANESITFESQAKIESDSTQRILLSSYSYAESVTTGTSADGQNAHAEGNATAASGPYSHAEGDSTTASGQEAHAEGCDTTASGTASHAEGDTTVAVGAQAHAQGYGTTALGTRSHAEGVNTVAKGANSHAAGVLSDAIHNNTHVWSSYSARVSSTATNQYTVSAGNGLVLGPNVYISHQLGVGTAIPAEKFTVAGNISALGGLSATGLNNYFSGKVGIGTIAPNHALSVVGTISATCGTSDEWCSTHTTVAANSASWDADFTEDIDLNCNNINAVAGISACDTLSITANAVGIGENIPLGKLHVKTADSGITTIDAKADDLVIESDGNVGMSILGGSIHVAGVYFPTTSDPDEAFIKYDHGINEMSFRTNGIDALHIHSAGSIGIGEHTHTPDETLSVAGSISAAAGLSATGLNNYFAGNVGIGTATPTYALDVAGNAGFDENLYHNGDGNTYVGFPGADQVNIVAGGDSVIRLDNSVGNPKIQLNNTNANIDVQLMADDGAVILHTDATTNNVGIGTITPDETLSVVGGISASTGLTAAGLNNYFAGNVGIGTATPTYKLDVAGSMGLDEYIYHNGDTDTFIRLQPDELNIEVGGGNMIFAVEGAGGDQEDKVTINNAAADIDFQVKGDSNTNLIRTDAANDRVGIGTTGPNELLTVAGNISALGGLSADGGLYTPSIKFVDSTIASSATSHGEFLTLTVNGSAKAIPLYSY